MPRDDGIDFETYDEPQWPTWLEAVAARVDELLADPFVSARFLVMVREWAIELDRKGSTADSPDRFRIYHHREVNISPNQRTSLAAKYGQLAAIHHEVRRSRARGTCKLQRFVQSDGNPAGVMEVCPQLDNSQCESRWGSLCGTVCGLSPGFAQHERESPDPTVARTF